MDRVAKPYAKAVFEYLGDRAKARTVSDELHAFSAWVSGVTAHREFSILCESDLFSVAKKQEVVADVAKAMKLSETAQRALSVLTEAKRLSVVGAVAEKLRLFSLEAEGVVPVDVYSADELSGAERTHLEAVFSKTLGKKIEAKYGQKSDLLGGVKISASGKTFDGTLSTTLRNLKEKLVGG